MTIVLEGGRAFTLGDGTMLRASFELGVRHDGGDAETGAGVEIRRRRELRRPPVLAQPHYRGGVERFGAAVGGARCAQPRAGRRGV